MLTNPKKNGHLPLTLINKFEGKGYICKKIVEDNSTVLILTPVKTAAKSYEKSLSRLLLESFKASLRAN